MSAQLVTPTSPDKQTTTVLLDEHDVAQMLNVNVAWVRNHSTRVLPLLPSVKLGVAKGAKRRYRREDIQQFIADHWERGRAA